MKKIFHIMFGRLTMVIVSLIIQVAILVFAILELSNRFTYVYGVFVLLSAAIVLWILNRDDNPTVKVSWIIVVMLVPVFGGLFYLMFGATKVPKAYRGRLIKNAEIYLPLYPENRSVMEEVAADNKNVAAQCKYIQNQSGMPVYSHTDTRFLPSGEIKFEAMKEELSKARHYIFLEYFIIQEGTMWNGILDILKEKAGEGLDVRLIFDDAGCINTLPDKYEKTLTAMGIKCVVFTPLRPVLLTLLQNRDHRKIAIIDGHTAFTGGINLADEYINAYVKHGHWKDCAVLIKGDAVWSLTLMFLEMWNFHMKTDENFQQFKPDFYGDANIRGKGYVQPYGDSPLDDELMGESVYLNIMNNATEYLYITTPYLVVDNELITALILAAKRGVDVRIITPYIEDKWYVHMVTQSYYKKLILGGVKIYEYTPGFIHGKTFLCDDMLATVGTINLDFRSLYHHFECGALMYKTETIAQMKQDFETTLGVSAQITLENCRAVPVYRRILRGFMRLMAPLM